jgi:hypothetical protein
VLLAQERGNTVDCEDYISLEKHRKIMNYAAAAGFEFDDFDNQHIDNYSVVRIYKNAPVLFRLINHLDKSFKVAMLPHAFDGNNNHLIHVFTSYSPTASFPAVVKKASYFVTSRLIWKVDVETKKFIGMEGYNLGLGNLKETSVSVNLEFQFGAETLIHEVIHLKQGNWNEKIVHEATGMVLQDCRGSFKRIEDLKPKLTTELNRIIRDFARFDHKVGQILGIKETDRLRAPRFNDLPGSAMRRPRNFTRNKSLMVRRKSEEIA